MFCEKGGGKIDTRKRITIRLPQDVYRDILDNLGNAASSTFNLELFDARSNYVSYIAQRPRVQRSGAHGLFTQEEDAPDLNAAARAVSEHDGNIWTCILSLRREDAARLSYDKADAWRAAPCQCGGDRRAVQCAGRVVPLVRSLPQRSAPSPSASGLLCGQCAKAGAHKGGGGAAPLPPRTADIPG